MSDKKKGDNKKRKKVVYPKSGVNDIWDTLMKLDGMEDMLAAVEGEEKRRGILNYVAGLAAEKQKELDEIRNSLTTDDARAAFASMSKSVGQTPEQTNSTIEAMKKMQADMEKKLKEKAATGKETVEEMIKDHNQKKEEKE